MSRLNGFLHGVRVLDLTRHLPGPLAALLLADMGADVLKIEPPDGDGMRDMGPRRADGRSAYFTAVNAGKTTRRMDLKRLDERAAFLDLVRTADVLIESFRPDVMARLGVGYETLKAVNSRLIYCSLNGFGCTGPLSSRAAHDLNYVALAGALPPVGADGSLPDTPLADCAGGLFAALAIVGALHGRARDGRGCHLDLALADAVVPLQILPLAALGAMGAPAAPGEGLLNGGAASYHVYDTADGRRVTLGAIEVKFWRAFCTAAGRPDWEPRRDDPLPQRALIAEVASMFRALTLARCEQRFGPADCCFAPVLELDEAIASAHTRSRGVVHRTADGDLQPLFPAIVDREPPAPRAPVREE
ncbi:MAG: CoA transferase [Acidobacteria bacterium]|nr:CoA transferase [Acidobacteriota bacterium]